MSKSCLFIYGSLLTRTCERRISILLRRHSRSRGKASVAGELLNLGAYPGLIESEKSASRVQGEVLILEHANRILPLLDAYEAFDATNPAASEFIRVQIPVRLHKNRQMLSCWVYLYAGASRYRQRIARGDYVAFINANWTTGNYSPL